MCRFTKMSFGLVVYSIEYDVAGPGFDSQAHPLLILRKKNLKHSSQSPTSTKYKENVT